LRIFTGVNGRAGRRRLTGFTLVELLVVLAIIAVLLSLIAIAIRSVRDEAKTLVCMNNMRATALAFRLFADPYARPDRGDSEALFGRRFSAWDFLESQYRASEFWPTASELEEGRFVYRQGRDVVLCPAAPGPLACVSPGFSLESGRAVAPPEHVGYAMNRRLLFAPFESNGYQAARFVTIGEDVLDHPNVPLLFDVDAPAAVARWGAAGPFFSAPAGKTPSIYDGTPTHPAPYWFPARRHHGKMIVSFVGGHLLATKDALADSRWDWNYHPPLAP
jgi:prepilin-type N-terminal cleavage/methylation domain-containing protein